MPKPVNHDEINRRLAEQMLQDRFQETQLRTQPLRMSLDQIKSKSDEQLHALLSRGVTEDGTLYPALIQAIGFELQARDLARRTRPHWSITPTFWVAVIAAVGTLAGLGLTTWSIALQLRQAALPPALAEPAPPSPATPAPQRPPAAPR